MVRSPNSPSLYKQLSKVINHYWRQITILITVIILLSFFFPQGKTLLYSYQLNDVAQEEVVAPFNFPILKTSDQLQLDLEEALNSEPFLFLRSQDVVSKQIEVIDDYFKHINLIQLANIKLADSKDDLYRNRFTEQFDLARINVQSDSAALEVLMETVEENYNFAFNDEKWNQIFLSDYSNNSILDLDNLKKEIIQISRNRWAEGIYDIPISEILSKQVAIIMSSSEPAELTEAIRYNDIQDAWTKARMEVTNRFPNNINFSRDLGYSLIVEFMKPNLIYDRETTERRQQARQDRVPRNKGIILKNERILDANTRVTEDDLQKLFSLSVAIDNKAMQESSTDILLAYVGRILVIGIIVSFFFTFLLTYRKPIFDDWRMVLLIGLIFSIEVGLAFLIKQNLELSEYLIPIIVAAMVLTIMFDARIAFMGITSIILLVTILIGNNV
ncbi:MAG: hypothetical protein HOK88_04255, partial [Candidatus Marinimicrobia bacterium]|nr:hypothetical protein [Candidatus Neomarinimicrobiota bacterium]